MPAQKKISAVQMETLLDYMASHLDFAKGCTSTEGVGRQGNSQQWQDLADRLNSTGVGTIKSGKDWRIYWNNLKYKVRCKVSKKRKYMQTIGGGATWEKRDLSEEEWKIINILGKESLFDEETMEGSAEDERKLFGCHSNADEPDEDPMAPPKMVSAIQMEILLDNMERNYEMAMSSSKNPDGRENICRKWAELAEDLNNAGDGCSKSADKWRKYWAERKYTVKRKLWDAQKKAEDGKDNSQIKWSAEENRILSIIGPTSFKGDNLDITSTADNDHSFTDHDQSFKRIKLTRSDSFDRSDSPPSTTDTLKYRPIAPAPAPTSTYAEIRIDRSNYAEPQYSRRPPISGRSQQFEEQCLSELSKIGDHLRQMVHLLGVLVEQNNSNNSNNIGLNI